MSDKISKLSITQKKAARLLVAGLTIKQTAKQCKKNYQRVRHWYNHNTTFQQYIEKLLKEYFEHINKKQSHILEDVYDEFKHILTTKNSKKIQTRDRIMVGEILLKVNHLFPVNDSSKVRIDGKITNEHSGGITQTIDIKPEALQKDHKELLKSLLSKHPELLSSQN